MTIEQYIVWELKEDIKFLIRKMTQLEQDIEELKNKILNNNKPSVSEKNELIWKSSKSYTPDWPSLAVSTSFFFRCGQALFAINLDKFSNG